MWYIDEADTPYIEKVVGIYLVNRAERTYLCSSTPSYWARCVGNYVRLKDGTPDEAPDYLGSRIQNKYEGAVGMKESDGYYNCSDIDNLPAEQLHHHEGIELDDEDAVVEAIDGGWWF